MAPKLFLFLSCCAILIAGLSNVHCYDKESEDDIQAQIKALDEFITANLVVKQPSIPPPDLNISSFPNFQVFQNLGDKTRKSGVCSACDVGMGFAMFKVRHGNLPEQDLERNAKFLCEFFKIAERQVCDGLIERYTPTIYYIVKTRRDLTSKSFCSVMLQSHGCKTNDELLDWSIDVPVRNISFEHITNAIPIARESGSRIKIAQLTDLHVDPLYQEGTQAECENEILCCQESHGRPENKSQRAGYFGDHRKCDTPYSTLELALKDMVERHSDAELFYMNGDLVPHNIWSTTKEENVRIIQDTAAMIWKYFPTMKIIPVLGNHETHPVNFFSPDGVPDELSTQWVYNVTYEAFKQWIPLDQKDIYLAHGYYAVEVNPKFRLLVINSNVCFEYNLWQMYEERDPGNQLEWLKNELQKSEDQQQTVHIVGHVPPSHDECFRVWSRNFYKIMQRYNHIVKGQFYGHTHFDELKVYYDKGQPINTLWIAPSLTPYEVNNAAYRVYYADPSDYQIMDHETWTFDLKLANRNSDKTPTWFRLYRGTEAYGIPDLSLKSLDSLLRSLAKDDNVFSLFYQHYHKIVQAGERRTCDTACKKQLLCGFVKSHIGDETECVQFMN